MYGASKILETPSHNAADTYVCNKDKPAVVVVAEKSLN